MTNLKGNNMYCRSCGSDLLDLVIDLGNQPPSNFLLNFDDLNTRESFFPLKIMKCRRCELLQTQDFLESKELFGKQYPYFSSTSKSWIEHSEKFFKLITNQLRLNSTSKVIELASNDGYLLKFFKDADIKVLGIEPTNSAANISRSFGIPTIESFFTSVLANQIVKDFGVADLIIANNVLAHVPDLKDFIVGTSILLKEDGVLTIEFPSAISLVKDCLFDTIYHEHFSYLTLTSVKTALELCDLTIFKVEELATHGNSLRIFAQHRVGARLIDNSVATILQKEFRYYENQGFYLEDFVHKLQNKKLDVLSFLRYQKNVGFRIAAYGAAAKGNTFLNYCDINSELIDYVVDNAPLKIDKYLPGSHIPIVKEETLFKNTPNIIVVLAWNVFDEIFSRLQNLFRDYPEQILVCAFQPHFRFRLIN